jgi:ParB-like chromosome segregation protein Spo0J
MSAPASKSNKSPFRHDLCVRLAPLASLKPFPRQIRSYPVTHIRKLAQSIDRFGWVVPIVADHQDRVVAGWALTLAARRLGLTEVPAVTVTELSNEELRGLRIALNRLSEDSASMAIAVTGLSFEEASERRSVHHAEELET